MTTPLRVVAVSGSIHEPSKTTVLLRRIVEQIGALQPIDAQIIEIAHLAQGFSGALRREDVGAEVEEALQAIETADVLVVGSPVYRASFTGLFKHLFDFVGQYALVGTPVLLAATGGGERHALILEHQLRPLFGFFQALTLPIGVYASDTDFEGYTLVNPNVQRRIEQAVGRSLPLVLEASRQPVSQYVTTW